MKMCNIYDIWNNLGSVDVIFKVLDEVIVFKI